MSTNGRSGCIIIEDPVWGAFELNRIHRRLAECLGAAEGSLRLLSGLHAHIAVFMSLAGIGEACRSA